MLKSYIKKIVKTELAKQKLNYIYGSKITYDTNYDHLNELVSHLNEVIHQQNSELSKLYTTNSSLKQENEALKQDSEEVKMRYNKISEENKELKNTLKGSKNTILELKELYSKEKLDKNRSLSNSYGKTYEIEHLKKELRDSKNGLNGANNVIKNNKEWINSQDKKIKELEEKIRCLKSDKEDLQYNLRRKSTQKIQLETKNKCLEDKFLRIYKTIEENYYQDGYYELLRIKNIIVEILKES